MRAISLSLLLVVAGTSTALAQDTAGSRAGEITNYEFEDELVDGGRYDPLGEILHTRRRSARATLIRARTHFIPEMLKSVERL